MTATPARNSSSAAPTKTAVIITALDVECRAVLRHLPEWTQEVVEGTVFYRGRFADHDVVVAEAGPGNAAAAALIERAIRHFNPRLALFVGVAGGVKDVSLGDVVVATKVYGYESGKEESKTFKPRAEVFRAAHEIEQRGRALSKDGRWRERLNPSVQHNETAHRAVRFAIEQIGVTSPVQIEFGLVGVRGVHFGVPKLDTWERIHGDDVVVQRVLVTADAGEVDAALLDFFSEVFDQTGQERPANLHNFPPGPLQPPNDFRAVG